MAYTLPTGTADLTIGGVIAYTLPMGTANLVIGHTDSLDRHGQFTGQTAAATGTIALRKQHTAAFSGATPATTGTISLHGAPRFWVTGVTSPPTGRVDVRHVQRAWVSGVTSPPTGLIASVYTPDLLSDVVSFNESCWRSAESTSSGAVATSQDGLCYPAARVNGWTSAEPRRASASAIWQPTATVLQSMAMGWSPLAVLSQDVFSEWQPSSFLSVKIADAWRSASVLGRDGLDRWQDAESRQASALLRVSPGESRITGEWSRWQPGLLLVDGDVEVWQPAGYPGNAPNPNKDPIPIFKPYWNTHLRLDCPLPGTALHIRRTPCILIAEREIGFRRTYMTLNSASLVRWPDLTPLPCTAMTIETDFDSWCWSLTATLAGPAAFALVQPNPLACEVQATVNGQVWRFLLDVPSTNRSFNSNRVTLKGRSRSAWLHDPYTPNSNRSEDQAREMVQLAEAALDNTGWTINWQLANWVVPAGRYNSMNTPIGVLIRLVNTTDDGLYTDPTLQVISAVKRWPVASWLLDGETMDLLIPEAAVLSLTQSPVYSQPYNGVYVSGTSHGALALVKIAGTNGALQPDEPLTHELICDEAGVAARARGLNVLSNSGAGWEMDAETLFAPSADPEFPLVPPGKIVSIAGMKGISRSCRISVSRSGGALSVRQSIGLERREVEA